MMRSITAALALLLGFARIASADYAAWQHAGSIYILTTPDGANLPAAASEANFPLLVRLHKDFFDFSQLKPGGDDLRFSTPQGAPLAYEIDRWDAAEGTAAIWVRVPTIVGNARQEIVLHWGNPAAASESDPKAVFQNANGYLSVWHMNDAPSDAVGTVETKDVGTTAAAGVIGQARHFAGKQGLSGGEKITGYPTGAGSHTSEAWFRAEKPNVRIIGWGNEHSQGKVVMQYESPPHMQMDCYFSNGNAVGKSAVPPGQWVHVVHTYEEGKARLYVNGVLDNAKFASGPSLALKSPARLYIGGWYDNYDFVGDMDEVRVSSVARSPNWVRLEYENEKPLQTLTGPVVQAGDAVAVSPARATVDEGKAVSFSARAGGAQKIYWILRSGGQENVVAVDRLHYTFNAGRVAGDKAVTLLFKAVYADQVKTLEIPIAIKEAIPDPIFTLAAPANWDGRTKIEVQPHIANLAEMQAAGAGAVRCTWTVGDIATTREIAAEKLILTRSQNSGKLVVMATLENGGAPVTHTAKITVTEPATDLWVGRTPAKDEKPQENEFYARDDKNEGTLHYNGALDRPADAVFLRLYADDKLIDSKQQKLGADRAYAFAAKLKPGLILYKVEFGSESGGQQTVLDTVRNLVCGDAYVINGQSNAVATEFGKEPYAFSSPWIRTFGSMGGGREEARLAQWGNATARAPGDKLQVGYWAMELGRRLVEDEKMPICMINGAVGGTRIDQHQRNPADPEDVTTIYGRLLWRVRSARLTDGIRGIVWHQGENDQGSDGPSGGYGYETYRQLFIDMAAAWKQDYPNIQHYYIFQIWPKSCSMGIDGSDNRLREVQRTLPSAFAHMSIMSTLGIEPAGTCHYPPAGYAEMARLICPLIERDNYGAVSPASITPPNLIRASYADDKKSQIALEFDQPVRWDAALTGEFYLDGTSKQVSSGAAAGNRLLLTLANPSKAATITYLDSKAWSQKTLLRGENGIAALTFCEVPIGHTTADGRVP